MWEAAENKSKLINDAIEFYAQHGQWIRQELKEIKELLLHSDRDFADLNKGLQIDSSIEKEKVVSEEELRLQEEISYTLSHFLGSDDD